MKIRIIATVVALAFGIPEAQADTSPSVTPPPAIPGIYSNEEQVYFAREAGKAAPPLIMISYDSDLRATLVDAFGVPYDGNMEGMTTTRNGDNISARLADGTAIELRRGRPVTCWSAIPKETKKADGSTDWFFAQNVKIHDQGGRAIIGKDTPDVKPVVIRMRNVIWPSGNNRPSLVLYVHTPDEPDKAVSYVWADPDAARIGINLRWMQTSCTVDGKEKPAG